MIFPPESVKRFPVQYVPVPNVRSPDRVTVVPSLRPVSERDCPAGTVCAAMTIEVQLEAVEACVYEVIVQEDAYQYD